MPIVNLEKEKFIKTGETTTKTPQQEVSTVAAPNAATQQFINNTVLQPLNDRMSSPLSLIGYNPEEERKRRQREQELNEAKRREAGLYNAVALIGDSLSAALGGNVWQREPDRSAAKAKADNERLIGEQKAEDARNAALQYQYAKDYANTINKAVQPYLTRIKSKKGGEEQKEQQWEKVNYREQQQLYPRRETNRKNERLEVSKAIAKRYGLNMDKDGYVSIDIPWLDKSGEIGRKTIRASVEDAMDYLQAHGHELLQRHNDAKTANSDTRTEIDDLMELEIYNPVKGFNYNQLKNHLVNTPGTEDSRSALDKMWRNSPDYTSGSAQSYKPGGASSGYKPKTKKKTGSSGF